jgi:hypothetical protein
MPLSLLLTVMRTTIYGIDVFDLPSLAMVVGGDGGRLHDSGRSDLGDRSGDAPEERIEEPAGKPLSAPRAKGDTPVPRSCVASEPQPI